MKRAIILVVMFSSALFAQVHGVPPSVTSFTGGKHMAPGVPASVTSLGPRGYSVGPCLGVLGCTNPNFRTTINFQKGVVEQGRRFNLQQGRHRGHGGNGSAVVPYVYAYPYPVYVDGQSTDEQAQDADQQQGEPPAPTIYERRSNVQLAPNPTPVGDSRYGDQYADPRQRAPEPQAQPQGEHHNMSPVSPDPIPIVIVYKDGHEQEIGNYAIVGDTLYDLGNFVSHKIKLADLDLNQTIQKNEDRGVEFNVPQSLKPKT